MYKGCEIRKEIIHDYEYPKTALVVQVSWDSHFFDDPNVSRNFQYGFWEWIGPDENVDSWVDLRLKS